MLKNISILGCGWLGLPLALELLKQGYRVFGSTTSNNRLKKLAEMGIHPNLLQVTEKGIFGNDVEQFFDVDVVIISIPPKRVPHILSLYPAQMKSVIKYLKRETKVLFLGSTSVYPFQNQKVDESFSSPPDKNNGKAVLAAEEILQASIQSHVTILRLAGLIGYERSPENIRKKLKGGKHPDAMLNLVHRDDVIQIVLHMLKRNLWGETFNVCADYHPTRREFYHLDMKEPDTTIDLSYKIVSNTKLKQKMNYEFLYSNPTLL